LYIGSFQPLALLSAEGMTYFRNIYEKQTDLMIFRLVQTVSDKRFEENEVSMAWLPVVQNIV
jgi:hypothetical protein